jgi:hypothetical protein
MNRFLGSLIFSLTLLAAWATAQRTPARPDLNGVWNLNVTDSDFGQVPPPLKQSETVTQAGATLCASAPAAARLRWSGSFPPMLRSASSA